MRPCPHCDAGHRATNCTDGLWHLYDAGGTYKCAPVVTWEITEDHGGGSVRTWEVEAQTLLQARRLMLSEHPLAGGRMIAARKISLNHDNSDSELAP